MQAGVWGRGLITVLDAWAPGGDGPGIQEAGRAVGVQRSLQGGHTRVKRGRR